MDHITPIISVKKIQPPKTLEDHGRAECASNGYHSNHAFALITVIEEEIIPRLFRTTLR